MSGIDLSPQWGVILDDRGSMDVYENRDQAEAARVHADGTSPLVRIDYSLIDPGASS